MELSTDIINTIKDQASEDFADIGIITSYLNQMNSSSNLNQDMDVFWELREADFSSVSYEDMDRFMRSV